MTGFHSVVPAGTVAFLLLSAPAMAQVTAQNVWDDWKAGLVANENATLSIGSEVYAGGVLTLSGLQYAADDGTGSFAMTIDEIVMTENGDGTVAIAMSETVPVRLGSTDGSGTANDISLALRQLGLRMTVSGSPDALTYDVAADRYAIEVTALSENGVAVPGSFVMGMNDLTGRFTSTSGDPRDVSYDLASPTVDIAFDLTDTETGSDVGFLGKILDASVTAVGTVPLGSQAAMTNPFAAGLDIEGGYSLGATDFSMDITEQGMATSVVGRIAESGLNFLLDGNQLGYTQSASGLSVNVTGGALPFPVAVALERYVLGLAMPMTQTEEPVEFAAEIGLNGLTVNEEIWSLVDPGAVLPRTPATVAAQVSGMARLLVDLTDPDYDPSVQSGPPGELHALSLDNLLLSFGGAEMSGTGAFTFDNSDLVTFGGAPRPQGEANFRFVGLNALLDKINQLGFVPADQVAMGRMMLGMFAVPAGDDVLTTKIEITPDARILANGQPLQ